MLASTIDTNPHHPEADSAPSRSLSPSRTLIGKPPNHWLYSPDPPTFDLTRPSPPSFPIPSPSESITLQTTTARAIISPALTALLIIDMQNFFLSPALGRDPNGAGIKAADKLLSTAIPAARKAGIRIIWLNWGLTQGDIDTMPPSIIRAFGFEAAPTNHDSQKAHENENNTNKEEEEEEEEEDEDEKSSNPTPIPRNIHKGLGHPLGPIHLPNNNHQTIDGGRILMLSTWNASLPPSLHAAYLTGTTLPTTPDIQIPKTRQSGLSGAQTPCTNFLNQQGITTLLFAGVNTDQCVAGSLLDACHKGWDCVLLSDCCGTTSPGFAKEAVEWNCERGWGFVGCSEGLERGVEDMVGRRRGLSD
ncbi:hypothetical protein MMC09_005319 [Bachmanniomyces sp. S44760]|nr:hypothetical protein [Bachmanniomyces sp. S44760]